MSPKVCQKLQRLLVILAQRATWASELAQVRRMQGWVLEAEQILCGSWAQSAEELSNESVGERLDEWRERLADQLSSGTLSQLEQRCLSEFVQVLSNLRPYLVQCYDHKDFPRTNNDMERSIRRLKTQYRRVSGRKNWNAYLLRYGRSVAYAAWWEQDATHQRQLALHVARLDRAHWRTLRRESKAAQSEQLKRFRFRHRRQQYLTSLEQRWTAVVST